MTEFVIPAKENRVIDIRRCSVCHHGYWKGEFCPSNCGGFKPIKIKEYIQIEISLKFVKKINKKKKIVKQKKGKKCCVCGEPAGRKICCSVICEIRNWSSWYSDEGREFITVEEAEKRLKRRFEKKRLKQLKHDSENRNI